ncbi:hypothetical protein PUN28_003542 [Cardiocondyla obscurior]|uniref:Uncharacterized protein n=1 Tax=Cardiocondyla obscurior TaxID=286306 RepID=A0AAW2GM44_9HYME
MLLFKVLIHSCLLKPEILKRFSIAVPFNFFFFFTTILSLINLNLNARHKFYLASYISALIFYIFFPIRFFCFILLLTINVIPNNAVLFAADINELAFFTAHYYVPLNCSTIVITQLESAGRKIIVANYNLMEDVKTVRPNVFRENADKSHSCVRPYRACIFLLIRDVTLWELQRLFVTPKKIIFSKCLVCELSRETLSINYVQLVRKKNKELSPSSTHLFLQFFSHKKFEREKTQINSHITNSIVISLNSFNLRQIPFCALDILSIFLIKTYVKKKTTK